MPYYVYMILCEDGSYYTGYSSDVERRFEQHESGRGAMYTRMNRPLEIAYVEEVECRGDAMRRELDIKSLRHDEKRRLAASYEKEE